MLGTIPLTEEESALLKQIDFIHHHPDEVLQRSCTASAQLTPMLLEREAIPESRLRYFTDPAYHDGKRSRLEAFERNGTPAHEVGGHGNFLKHLRYFIHGSGLPSAVQKAMQEAVGDPTTFSSGDLESVRKRARQLVRQHELGSTSADAFFQLMIDLGLSADEAHSVRKTVATVR